MGKISNLSSYGFNEQPQFDGFINSLKEKADTTEIAEQVKKQESDIKNINDINTKQDEQILGLNVDIKQSGNAFTFTQGGKNLAVINQENGEGSSVIGGSFSNGKLTLNNSNNTSVEIDASSLAFKGDATSIPNLDAYATKQWVEDKKYLTQHQSLDDYAKTSEVSGELAKKSNVGHTHQISDITDLRTQLDGYATEEWVTNKGYLTTHQSLSDYAKKTELANYYTKVESDDKYALKTSIPTLDGYATEDWVNSKGFLTTHQDLTDYAKKTELTNYYTKVESDGKYALSADIPSLNGYATEQWVTNQGYLTTHQSLEDYATKEQLSTKADKEHTHLLKDITDYVAPNLSIYAKKTDIPSLNGYATEEWVNSKGYLTNHQSLTDYAKKTELANYYTKVESDGKYALSADIPSLNGYATEQWVENKGYLTTHQSLTDYAKKAELANYYTKAESDGKYALSVDIPSLNGYATEQWVENKGYLTTHQSLEDYAKKTDLSTKADKEHTHLLKDITDYEAPNLSIYAKKTDIPSLNGYATEQWVTDKGYLTSHQDLTDYAKKAEIKTVNGHSLIGSGDIQIEGGSSVDLSNYYTKTDSDGKYALKTDIPSLNGYATEQWVTDKNYLTQHQSLDDYAKKTEIPSLEGYYTKTESDGKYALKTNIPSLNGYATEQWVNQQGYLTQHQSLEDYYTKTESDGKYALKTNIPSLNGYATEQWVNQQGYLTQHQSLDDYAKKTEIPSLEGYATKTDLSTKQDKGDYALKSDIKPIPSVLSAFHNDVGYLTTHQDLTSYAKKTDIPSLEGYVTEQWVTSKGYLTSHQDISGKQDVLVSGTNIKTVNGATLLGSGNIQIEIGEQALASYAKTADIDAKLDKKANVQHTHEISDVTNLQTKLNGYALKTEIQEVPKFKTVNGQAITGSTDNIEITTDLSNYYKKTETSGATEIRDALANKQDYNENYVTSDQLAGYATTSYVNSELGLKANATDIPTNTIELTFTLTDGTQITKTFYIQL